MDKKHLASNFKVFLKHKNIPVQRNDNNKKREKFWNQIKRRENTLNSSPSPSIAMKRAFTFNNASNAKFKEKKIR